MRRRDIPVLEWALGFALILAPCSATAAGILIPDLGANALGQGGAWIPRIPTDGMALYYNPAGLAEQHGLNAVVDGHMISQGVSFQRAPTDSYTFNRVSNGGSPTPAPSAVVSYRWEPPRVFPITFAIGGFPFSGGSGYRYPDPTQIRASAPGYSETQISEATPQRYSSIASQSSVFTSALAVAAQVRPWLSLGAELQLVTGTFYSRQSIYALPLSGESTSYDAVINIQASDPVRASGLFGASVRLPGGVSIGASYQLPVRFHAAGTITAELPPTLQGVVGVTGDHADISIDLPWIARAGIRFARPFWEVELAGTYEAWSMERQVELEPKDISIVALGKSVPLAPIYLQKGYVNAGSLRLGGIIRGGLLSQRISFLSLRLGVIGETSAVPTDETSIDVPDWQRLSLNAGLGFTWRNYELVVAYAHFIQPARTVSDSVKLETVAFPAMATPTVVGNGTYTSQIDVVDLAISAHFL